MAVTIEEFETNELRAKRWVAQRPRAHGKPLHRMKITNFYHGDDFRKVLNINLELF